MRNVTEIQRRLIELGYLAAGEDDGTFGPITLAAYNRFRASKGEGPHTGLLLLVEIAADVFPEDQPAKPAKHRQITSNPITNWLIGLAIKQAVSALKGLSVMGFLTGYKTFAIGALLILLGASAMIGLQVPGVPLDPSAGLGMIMSGIGLITGRVGAKTEAKKATGQL